MEENKTLGTENPEKKKLDYWQIVITVIAFAFITSISRTFFGNGKIVYAVIAGAVGGGLGSLLAALVKYKKIWVKIVTVIVEFLVLFAALAAVLYIKSDKYILEKDWNVYKFGTVSFAYPTEFKELDVAGVIDSSIADAKAYMADAEDNFAACYIYDFNSVKPEPQDSLAGAVQNIIAAINADNLEWIDPIFTEDTVASGIRYTINGKERNGLGFIYFEGDHYEVLVFMPYAKDFEPEFIQKIKDGIQ